LPSSSPFAIPPSPDQNWLTPTSRHQNCSSASMVSERFKLLSFPAFQVISRHSFFPYELRDFGLHISNTPFFPPLIHVPRLPSGFYTRSQTGPRSRCGDIIRPLPSFLTCPNSHGPPSSIAMAQKLAAISSLTLGRS